MRVLSSAVLVVVCLLSGAESGLVWDDKK